MRDELNPDLMFNGTYTELLVKAVNGEIDLNKLAAQQLAARGFDKKGQWVGFKKAAEIHGVA